MEPRALGVSSTLAFVEQAINERLKLNNRTGGQGGLPPQAASPSSGREGVTLAIPQNDTVGMISPEHNNLQLTVFLKKKDRESPPDFPHRPVLTEEQTTRRSYLSNAWLVPKSANNRRTFIGDLR